jgi:hypothetical protein
MAALARRPIWHLLILFLLGRTFTATVAGAGQPWHPAEGIASSRQLSMGGATLQVDFANGPLDLPVDAVLQHIQAAASAVTAYYGRFPVARARILVVPVAGRRGETIQGTTWGDVDGYQGFTRLRIAEHATAADLADDWVTTHELVHMAFPSLPDDEHWMEEGLATYIEPIARVKTGELQARKVWQDMVRGMPQGEPEADDQGLDRTHTWGRTYWGGALFCLVADVSIRRETKNKKGLQDALRAIVEAGGTIDHEWDLPKALAVGDKATGTHVLMHLYDDWKDKPVTVDLDQIWRELGVSLEGDSVRFDDAATLAAVRKGITESQRDSGVSGG